MTKQWLPTLVSGRLVFALLLTALLAVLVRQRRSLELLAAIVLPFPFLYALSGYTWYLDEPRYLGLLAPAARPAHRGSAHRPAPRRSRPRRRHHPLGDRALPCSRHSRVRVRRRPNDGRASCAHVRSTRNHTRQGRLLDRVRITFLTGERIIVASPQSGRYRRYDELVAKSPSPARIYVAGTSEETSDRTSLLASGYERIQSGPFAVYVPGS